MANPVRGETTLQVGDKIYTLVLTTNAICAAEDATDKGIGKIIDDLTRFSYLRALFWASLGENHPEVTLKQAGSMMQEVGSLVVIGLVQKALALGFPKPDKDAKASPPTQNRA